MSSNAERCVIVAGKRTAFGRFGGPLRDHSIPQLAAVAMEAALADAGLRGDEIDEVALGVNLPGSDRSLGRQAALMAGMPETINAYTVDRACCSSLTATSLGLRAIRSGEAELVVAGGAENLSKVPYFVEDLRWGQRLGDVTLRDQLVISCPYTGVPRAVQASNEAAEYGVTRDDQDRWALRSHEHYFRAKDAGFFDREIVPVAPLGSEGSPGLCEDESPRKTSLDALARLQPVYGSRSVTPGNAPGLSTGASAVILTSHDTAVARGLPILAELRGHARASDHPDKIASIPARAAMLALERAGLSLEAIDVIEINEAFAAVPLVSTIVLAREFGMDLDALRHRTNPNGGAIAIGHPTGATGGRMLITAAHELRRRSGRFALVTMCGGIAEGEAFVIEDAAG